MYWSRKPDRDHQPRHEAAARRVVSAKEEERRDDAGDGKDDRTSTAGPAGTPPRVAARFGLTRSVCTSAEQRPLLRRKRQDFGRGPEAPQERVDGERHERQHHAFAEGVEPAEVDQHHVHDVAPAAAAAARARGRTRCAAGSSRVITA